MNTMLTWKYVIDRMADKYGIREDSDEEFSKKELDLYIRDVFAEYDGEQMMKILEAKEKNEC